MTSDKVGRREELLLLEEVVKRRRRKLKAASYDFKARMDQAGWSSAQVGQAAGLGDATVRKLTSDGDKTGWNPLSGPSYEALDGFAAEHLHISTNLADLGASVKNATQKLDKAQKEWKLAQVGRETDEILRDSIGIALLEYLMALTRVLDHTDRWIPHETATTGFEQRYVSVHDAPPPTVTGDMMPLAIVHAQTGDVRWEQAVADIGLAVVLGDAGAGKSWQLRDHAHRTARQALRDVETSVPIEAIRIPLFLHAHDLARRWREDPGASAVISAAVATVDRIGGAPTPAMLREYLGERVRDNATAEVIIDGYDEVFAAGDKAALVLALRWLQARADGVFNVIIASRYAGYDSPFDHHSDDDDHDGPHAPTYLQLGLLEPDQIRRLWHKWFRSRGAEWPQDRLEPVLAPQSPLRLFVGVPLIAAFCAWVAEVDVVRLSRAGLYKQVIDRFLGTPWKGRDTPDTDWTSNDRARRRRLMTQLQRLAWHMALAQPEWSTALAPEQVESLLTTSAISPLPGKSLTWELVRHVGILTQPAAGADDELGETEVLWVHRSVHEFLVAAELVTAGTDVVDHIVNERAWFHSGWGHALDFAMGLEVEEAARPVYESVTNRGVSTSDGLGWFASLLASSAVQFAGSTDREASIRRLRALQTSCVISWTDFALATALMETADEAAVVAQIVADLGQHPAQARDDRWTALAWLGEAGRAALGDIVAIDPDAGGAAAALYSVDAAAAVNAVRRRAAEGYAIAAADRRVLEATAEAVITQLVQRYESHPDDVDAAWTLARTHHHRAREVLGSPEYLQSEDALVRRAAAAGIAEWYFLDLDRTGFAQLVTLATTDPDRHLRQHLRSTLEVISFHVPWVRRALADYAGALYMDPRPSELVDVASIASAMTGGGPAAAKAIRMVREEPGLLQGEVLHAMRLVTAIALSGQLDVIQSRDVFIIGGPQIIELAVNRLRGDDIDNSAAGTLSSALAFACADDSDLLPIVYSAVVVAAYTHDHPLISAALRLCARLGTLRIEILLAATESLTTFRPNATSMWLSAARDLLAEIPYTERRAFLPAADRATHVAISTAESTP